MWRRAVHGDGILDPCPPIPTDFTPFPTRPRTDSDPSPQKVHRDQLRAQRSVTSMGNYLYIYHRRAHLYCGVCVERAAGRGRRCVDRAPTVRAYLSGGCATETTTAAIIATSPQNDAVSSINQSIVYFRVKVKFSHSRYRELGPELIPVYMQSARR